MNFEPTEDRRMLAEALGRQLAASYPIEHRNRVAYAAPYHDPDKWAEIAGNGFLQAFATEAEGGLGGTGFDIATVFEELGRALCPEPVLPQLMAIRLLSAAGAPLEAALSGQTRLSVAIGELSAPYELEGIETVARGTGADVRLTGRKSVVYGGLGADAILVAARGPSGLGVYRVAGEAARVTGFGMIDGGNAAEVFLEDTPAEAILPEAGAALRDALDAGALALCAEAVGVMAFLHDAVLDYLRTRRQFGKAIGSFQVLQHRMVDLAIEIEQARSITILAAAKMGGPEQSRTVSMAKTLIGRAGKLVAEEAIQMHGGIAVTWEYPVSHYAKRLVMIDHQLGDTDFHLERVMEAHMAT